MTLENVIIIGSGPAGLTAALYTARANLNPIVFTGQQLGGQIATTTEVENYPGFPNGTTGPDLYNNMQQQAEHFGARVVYDEVAEVDINVYPFVVKTYNEEYQTRSLIIATGASPRKLGVPGENEYIGRGVSYCATCDGFFFKGKELIVVGGGDSALQEGLFLTKFASQVSIVHRRDQLRAGVALVARARRNEKMHFIWNSVVKEVLAENGSVDAVRLQNVVTGEETVKPLGGVFVYIGHYPNTSLFEGKLAMNEEGYLLVNERLHTDVPGVFAAGEVHDHYFRQAIVSAGFGCMAAMEAEKFLAEQEGNAQPPLEKPTPEAMPEPLRLLEAAPAVVA